MILIINRKEKRKNSHKTFALNIIETGRLLYTLLYIYESSRSFVKKELRVAETTAIR